MTPASHTSAAFFCCLASKTLLDLRFFFFLFVIECVLPALVLSRQLVGTPFRVTFAEEALVYITFLASLTHSTVSVANESV